MTAVGLAGGVREPLGLPLRAARLTVPLAEIEQRLASDATSGRRDDQGSIVLPPGTQLS